MILLRPMRIIWGCHRSAAKIKNSFKLFPILFLMSFAVGCSLQEEKADPQVTHAEAERSPQLITSPPKTMDLLSTQKNPAAVMAEAGRERYPEFFFDVLPSTQPPTEKAGAQFVHDIRLNGKALALRGVTIRKFEMSNISLLTIYTAAFYAPVGQDFAETIPDGERVLILEYHLEVPKEKVVQAIKDNVYSNPKVNAALVEPYFEQLSDAFDSPKKGDRYEFAYIPGKGTTMIKAGRVMTMIPTAEFAHAFFGIWLSPHGKDHDMRCEILSLPCPKSNLNPVNLISNNLGNAKDKLGKLKNLVT